MVDWNGIFKYWSKFNSDNNLINFRNFWQKSRWFLSIYKFRIKFINNYSTLNGEFEDEYEADFTKGFKQEGGLQDAPAGGKYILAAIVWGQPQLHLKDNFGREEGLIFNL